MLGFGLLALAGLVAPATSHIVAQRYTAFRRDVPALPTFGFDGPQSPVGWHALDPEKNDLCAHGKEQSPINFSAGTVKTVLDGESTRPRIDYPSIPHANVSNLGVTVETRGSSGELTMPTDGSVWVLDQFHFHTPSEHRLADEWFPLEIHFVHKKKDDATKFLVLGITFEIADCGTRLVQRVLEPVDQIPNLGDVTQTKKLDFDEIAEHVKHTDIYQYRGSFTVPPCSEGVTWLVSSKPLPLDVKTYLAAKRAMKFNSRYTQNAIGDPNLLELAAAAINGKP